MSERTTESGNASDGDPKPAKRSTAVEIAVQDLGGVEIALDRGADRVELCMALAVGGLTPSAALIRGAVHLARARGRDDFVHVLVRSRPGDFVYSADEVELMRADVEQCAELGAAGVVIGALTAHRELDLPATRSLISVAGGLDVTFHRAFDVVVDLPSAARALAFEGVRRVLTSGGASRVGDGLAALRRLVASQSGLEIMAGGGLTLSDIGSLAELGIDAVHLSAKREVSGYPAGPGGGPAHHDVTDAELVAAVVREARALAR